MRCPAVTSRRGAPGPRGHGADDERVSRATSGRGQDGPGKASSLRNDGAARVAATGPSTIPDRTGSASPRPTARSTGPGNAAERTRTPGMSCPPPRSRSTVPAVVLTPVMVAVVSSGVRPVVESASRSVVTAAPRHGERGRDGRRVAQRERHTCGSGPSENDAAERSTVVASSPGISNDSGSPTSSARLGTTRGSRRATYATPEAASPARPTRPARRCGYPRAWRSSKAPGRTRQRSVDHPRRRRTRDRRPADIAIAGDDDVVNGLGVHLLAHVQQRCRARRVQRPDWCHPAGRTGSGSGPQGRGESQLRCSRQVHGRAATGRRHGPR